jgi:hypothetical protein
MTTTTQHIYNELVKVQGLLWSGSLHEVDQAHNIIVSLIKDVQPE